MNVLAGHGWGLGKGFGRGTLGAGVTELCLFLGELGLYGFVLTMVVLAVLDWEHIVLMLLLQDLSVLHRLDRGVEMVLMDLAVDDLLLFFMMMSVDGLVGDGGSDSLVNGGVMVARLGHKVLDCSLGFLHDDLEG